MTGRRAPGHQGPPRRIFDIRASGRIAWLVGALCAPGAWAQPAGATPVEPGFADVGPSRTSLRVEPHDLRQPLDFERVYTLGRVSAFGTDEVFLRVSGGITAVFPRSVYVKSREGGAGPVLPPGTTFYIGRLPDEFVPAAPAPARAPSLLATDLSIDLSAGSGREAGGSRTPARAVNAGEAPSMWENEEYRQARMGQLLRRAQAQRR